MTELQKQRLAGKVAVITGGGTGIGAAAAELFAQHGARVAIGNRSAANGEAAVRRIREQGGECIFVPTDVTREGDCTRLIKEAVNTFGGLHILVPNAAIAIRKNLVDHTEEEWDQVIDTNVKGIFFMCKHGIPEILKSGGGSIIIVSSIGGMVGVRERAAYCASKGAGILMARQIALDYATQGIRCNALCPGTTDTPLLHEAFEDVPDVEAVYKSFVEQHPLGRIATPMEVAYGALYLASDESSFVTGSTLLVDGGCTAI